MRAFISEKKSLEKDFETLAKIRTKLVKHPVDTGRKLNVHKTFKKRPVRLLNVLCTFSLRPLSTGHSHNKKRVDKLSVPYDSGDKECNRESYEVCDCGWLLPNPKLVI